MRAAYLDSPALVKLYVREDGSEAVEALYQALEVAACHEIGFVEVRAALAAARRAGRYTAEEHVGLVNDFVADWEAGVSQVGRARALIRHPAGLAEGFGLRGYDAVHLAAAERIRSAFRSNSCASTAI